MGKANKKKNQTKEIKKTKEEKPKLLINNFSDFKKLLLINLDILSLLVFLCVGVYLNILNNEFISDDITGYVKNPAVRNFWGSWLTLNIIPITQASIYSLFGLNPIPLHINSLVLHILVTILVFIFAHLNFNKRIAIAASVLFAAHPLNTESVSWIAGSRYLYNAGFILLTLIFYKIYKDNKNKKFLWYAIGAYGAGLILTQQPWILTLPFIIYIYDQLVLEKKINIKSAITLTGFLITTGFALIAYVIERSARKIDLVDYVTNINPESSAPMNIRIPYTIYSSIKLIFYPKDLTLYHEGEQISQNLYYLMVLVTMAFIALVIINLKKNRKLAGYLLIALFSILPTLSPIQVSWFIAERYLYFAVIIFSMLLAWGIITMEEKVKIKNLAFLTVLTIVSIYSFKTIVRNNEWSTRKSLWEATARVSPYSPKVHNNLGDVYILEGNAERSIKEFETAILLKPNYYEAIHNLGNTYLQIGNLDKAEEYFLNSLEFNPNLYQSLFKLGYIEFQRENYTKAEDYFNKVLELVPGNPDSINAIEAIKAKQLEK